MPFINRWRLWAEIVLIVASIGLAVAVDQRGREIELLQLKNKTLLADYNNLTVEKARLEKSARAVSLAAQAQGLICSQELGRRAQIEELVKGGQTPIPETAIDDQSSRKIIDLLNDDLFAPLGHGLRRP